MTHTEIMHNMEDGVIKMIRGLNCSRKEVIGFVTEISKFPGTIYEGMLSNEDIEKKSLIDWKEGLISS